MNTSLIMGKHILFCSAWIIGTLVPQPYSLPAYLVVSVLFLILDIVERANGN